MLDYDDAHKAIKGKIISLEEKINSLEAHKKDWELQHQALSRMRQGYKEDPTNPAIKKQEERANSTPRPDQLETQINVIRKEIEGLWKEYFTTEFILPPIHLETIKSYVNRNGTEVRYLKDGGRKLFLFENSQYPTEHTKLLLNEDGSPNTILRFAQTSDTYGYVMKFFQGIILDGVPVPKEPVKTVTPKPIQPIEENLENNTKNSTDKKPKRCN